MIEEVDGVALVNGQDPHRLPHLPQGGRRLSRHETKGTAGTRLAAYPAAKAVARLRHHHHAIGGHPPERAELAEVHALGFARTAITEGRVYRARLVASKLSHLQRVVTAPQTGSRLSLPQAR